MRIGRAQEVDQLDPTIRLNPDLIGSQAQGERSIGHGGLKLVGELADLVAPPVDGCGYLESVSEAGFRRVGRGCSATIILAADDNHPGRWEEHREGVA